MIMALVVHFNLELHQIDVKTTLLNGNLDEEIYMVQLLRLMVVTIWCVYLKDLYIVSSKLPDSGTSDLMMW